MKKKAYVFLFATVCLIVAACGGSEGFKRIEVGQMHPEGTFDGVYHSQAYGRMELTQNGGSVIGLYEGERHFGKIEGTVEGDLLEFRWTQWKEDLNGKVRSSKGHGYFKYEVVVEGTPEKPRLTHFLKGEWGYGEDNSGNPWEAVKFPAKSKKILQPRNVGGTSSSMDEDFESATAIDDDGGSGESSGSSGVDELDSTPSESQGLDDDVNDLF